MTITALYNKGMTNKTCVYPNLAVSLYTWVQERTDDRTYRPYVLICWSTSGWNLLSHNNSIYAIASCVGLCVIHYDQMCPRCTAPSRLLMMSCTNWINWVSQDLWLRKPCGRSASMLSKFTWTFYRLDNASWTIHFTIIISQNCFSYWLFPLKLHKGLCKHSTSV